MKTIETCEYLVEAGVPSQKRARKEEQRKSTTLAEHPQTQQIPLWKSFYKRCRSFGISILRLSMVGSKQSTDIE